ncbi:MAG TPA: hypothetical protein ENJ95_19315, partial [Bacteroidetes bacterium]|nr:hypothetical protein [Bacteroidota bacterium]
MPLNHPARFLVVFLLFLLGCACLSAQSYHLTRHFTTEDGLAGTIARNGFMDSKGYLWISTFNGLSRYDGTTFKNYYHDPADPTSLCWNSTGGFAEDDAGHLWIATGKGLAMFDYVTESFSCYTNDPSDSTSISGNLVQGVFQDSEKQLWVFTHSAGMNLFDKKTGTF